MEVWGPAKLRYLMVKKYMSSYANLGTRGEVQNAIAQSLSTHINKN